MFAVPSSNTHMKLKREQKRPTTTTFVILRARSALPHRKYLFYLHSFVVLLLDAIFSAAHVKRARNFFPCVFSASAGQQEKERFVDRWTVRQADVRTGWPVRCGYAPKWDSKCIPHTVLCDLVCDLSSNHKCFSFLFFSFLVFHKRKTYLVRVGLCCISFVSFVLIHGSCVRVCVCVCCFLHTENYLIRITDIWVQHFCAKHPLLKFSNFCEFVTNAAQPALDLSYQLVAFSRTIYQRIILFQNG